MRKVLLTLATASLLLSVMTFAPLSADAMTLGDPAAVATQAQSSLLQQVDCRTIWRCGYWGCGWRNVCWGGVTAASGVSATSGVSTMIATAGAEIVTDSVQSGERRL
jgi:hypothetical protein